MLALPRFMRTTPTDLTAEAPSRMRNRLEAITLIVGRHSVILLRMSLGLVFLWFGALKITSSTPVAELVANTVPFVPAGFLLPALGAFEVLIGLGLVFGRFIGVVVCLMVGHLAGTFLVLVTQPEVAFMHSNPLQLSMTGEFVVKNLVLIAAGLVLATTPAARRELTSAPRGID
jgi:putative oxidoreductase